MINSLDVYLYGNKVATITRTGENLSLRYVLDYIISDRPVPISVQLPVVAGVAPRETTKRFLENLLPDRPDVRTKWARDAGLSNDSAFELLTVYGADVAGALELYPSGHEPRMGKELTSLTSNDIADRVRQIRRDDTDWLQHRRAEHGFSLGGAQGKFALARRNEEWFEPSGTHASTHIFKPGIQKYPGSDITEHITLRAARTLGLRVANTEIAEFDGEHVLIVERFDRLIDTSGLIRIHQEDLAQATGHSYVNKYENDGGPDYRAIFAVFDRVMNPQQARNAKTRFAECLVFSWLIGHNDGHAKNYSITHVPGESTLSPFYDLNSALAFELPANVKAKDYRLFDHVQLAFSIDGASTIGDIGLQSFQTLETHARLRAGHLIDFLANTANDLQAAVGDAIESLPKSLQEHPIVELYPYATYAQTLRVRDLFRSA